MAVKIKMGARYRVTCDTAEKGNVIEITGVKLNRYGTGWSYETVEIANPGRTVFNHFDNGSIFHKSLVPVDSEKVILYRNGREVVAKDPYTGKTAVAKCNPSDEFDFATGAKIALERLLGSDPVSVPGHKPEEKKTLKASDFKIGDYIRIIDAGCGARDANGHVGTLVKGRACHGLYDTDPGINVRLENGEVWRIHSDAAVERPEFYSGRFKVVSGTNDRLEVGKVYEVIDGKFRLPKYFNVEGMDEFPLMRPLKNFHDLRAYLRGDDIRFKFSDPIRIKEVK